MQNILRKEDIKINCPTVTSNEAIIAIGNLLVEKGAVKQDYIQGMLNRDEDTSVYIGNQIAIPHGESQASQYVENTGLAVMIYPEGINWRGEEVKVVIGIGAKADEHMEILSNIAIALMEEETVEHITKCQDVNEIYNILVN